MTSSDNLPRSDKELVLNALEIAKRRLASQPDFYIYKSIVRQLEYLSSVIKDPRTDRSRLKDIMVGLYGAREFETTDRQFAEALFEAQNIADKLTNEPQARSP